MESVDNFTEHADEFRAAQNAAGTSSNAGTCKRKSPATPASTPPAKISEAKSKEVKPFVSSMLSPYLWLKINYKRYGISTYSPSCLMMDYILHLINENLCDNHYFKRDAPGYHPYVLRLYYGVLFYIQCLRAGDDAGILSNSQKEFLINFVYENPLDQLPIAGPLLPLFRTLCSSEPEFESYGKVAPILPSLLGPSNRSTLMRPEVEHQFLPNVPGIFSLIHHLKEIPGAAEPTLAVMPRIFDHTPVLRNAHAPQAVGRTTFPLHAERTNLERFSLCSPGLQYPCEADQHVHLSFLLERYHCFQFPEMAANDNLESLEAFLHLNRSKSWFSRVTSVAETAAKYTTGSGKLSDCSPSGLPANQYVCVIQEPDNPIQIHELQQSADPNALFPFHIHLETSVRKPAPMVETMAAMAQTHIRMFASHPYSSTFGTPPGTGPFWDVRPIYSSPINESAYGSVPMSIKNMMPYKLPKSS